MSARHARTAARPGWRSPTLNWHGYAPLDASIGAQFNAAAGDVAEGIRRWRSWTYLAIEQVKNQYRRTVIGPWWLTLQTAAMVSGLAVLFGSIFGQPLHDFLPYIGGGFIGFWLLSGLTGQGAGVFVNNASTLTSTRQPLSALVFHAVTFELLQFGHNLVIIASLAALGLVPLGVEILLVAPAVLIILLNGLAVGLWLGPTVARFRDVGPLVASIMQMMMFFTPVFWSVDDVDGSGRNALVAWNPFAYLLDLFRDPLLGEFPSAATWTGVAGVTAVNVALAVWVFSRARSRLPYWVS
ncbi:ABC transporter permease [Nocardioides sp.]|uniref:ABC transporter permease n=1 Tax=Nocardioides sp. TaxID=35761 RepID=UPI00261B2B3F|nr:ABC transporter permease [Nocardioides sp.]MDI6910884.1 ABC transporter permease [Nocardioides sp.]